MNTLALFSLPLRQVHCSTGFKDVKGETDVWGIADALRMSK